MRPNPLIPTLTTCCHDDDQLARSMFCRFDYITIFLSFLYHELSNVSDGKGEADSCAQLTLYRVAPFIGAEIASSCCIGHLFYILDI